MKKTPRRPPPIIHKIAAILVFSLSHGFMPFATADDQAETKRTLIDLHVPQSVLAGKPVLIAHRGGVITDETPECSLSAIRLAKQHGYAMVELDVRRSKDGVPIVFHDRDMKKACGLDRRVADLTAEELTMIHYLNADQTICTLDQALAESRRLDLGIMLDVKARADEKFYRQIVALIKRHQLNQATVTISGDQTLRQHLQEIALLTVTQEEFTKVAQGEAVDLRHKFWFGLPNRLPSPMVRRLQNCGAYVFPAINTFRYPADQHFDLARKDVQRLTAAGVDGYQIDSVYQSLFNKN